MVVASDYVSTDAWQHVTLRYDNGHCDLTMFTNGTKQGEKITRTDAEVVDWGTTNRTLLNFGLGFDGSNHYQGLIDEVRVYHRPLTDAEIDDYVSQAGLLRQNYQRMLSAQYDMNYPVKGDPNLRDHSYYGNHGTLVGDPTFVESHTDYIRFLI
uniref:LamG-like jellyroll fold domain-containing protein n=1 Tax=Ciona intestinalis TaxID=7719 RepID=F6UPE8_CIOIN